MPKLNPDTAQKVENAEDGYAPIPDGVYELELMEDVEVAEGAKGPYWKWTFQIPEGLQYAGRRFWNNTSLSESAFWKLKEAFDAFGVPTSTDTEDLVKRRVKALIVTTTINSGSRKGEPTNQIDKLMPLNAPDATPGDGPSASTVKQDDPLF